MSSYVAARLDGSTTLHTSIAALRAAQRRAKGARTVIDWWPATDPPPVTRDARAWDAWRLRRGVAS